MNDMKKYLFSLVGVLFVFGAIFFVVDQDIQELEKLQSDSKHLRKTVKEYEPSVVKILTESRSRHSSAKIFRFTGTGWFIREGLIMTNAHVTQKKNKVRVKLVNDKKVPGVVLMENFKYDLALIKPDLPEDYNVNPLEVSYDKLSRHERILYAGNPFDKYHFDLGSFLEMGEKGFRRVGIRRHDVMIVKLDVGPGASGSPVLNRNGKVVGVVEGMYRGIDLGIVVPAKYIKKFMNSYTKFKSFERIRKLEQGKNKLEKKFEKLQKKLRRQKYKLEHQKSK